MFNYQSPMTKLLSFVILVVAIRPSPTFAQTSVVDFESLPVPTTGYLMATPPRKSVSRQLHCHRDARQLWLDRVPSTLDHEGVDFFNGYTPDFGTSMASHGPAFQIIRRPGSKTSLLRLLAAEATGQGAPSSAEHTRWLLASTAISICPNSQPRFDRSDQFDLCWCFHERWR